jgi:hypothetical protein
VLDQVYPTITELQDAQQLIAFAPTPR